MFYTRTKKIIPYFLTLIIFVGVFGLVPTKQVHAEASLGTCNNVMGKGSSWCAQQNGGTGGTFTSDGTGGNCSNINFSQQSCTDAGSKDWFSPGSTPTTTDPSTIGTCTTTTTNLGAPSVITTSQTTAANCTGIGKSWSATTGTNPDKSAFVKEIEADTCLDFTHFSMGGCAKSFFFYVVYVPSAAVLAIAASFFNALISVTLDSTLFSKSTFIPTAWGVVRDLSNIFFILILLYVAVQLILDMHGADAKKTIARVVLIALLINFSMFFTEIVIDSSNILALVFYNKLEVAYKDPTDGKIKARPYDGITGTNEKDISGSMYGGFDPTSKLNEKFWEKTKQIVGPDGQAGTPATQVPTGTMIAVILVASTIMIFASYAFIVSGLAFLGRMIELWVLIIFSPFAFMSFTLPKLSGIEDLGWSSWSKRLLSSSFMAPVFMFFMYLIFLLLGADLFGNLATTQNSWIQTLLLVMIPAALILTLLLKAVKYAKKGSGAFGEMVISGAKMVGGFALGAATGGAAVLGTGLIGGAASRIAGNEDLKQKANDKGIGGFLARKTLQSANYGSKATFDIRKTAAGGTFSKFSGMNLQSSGMVGLGSKEGGYKGTMERKAKAFNEERETYKTTKTNKEVEEMTTAKHDEWIRNGGNPEDAPEIYHTADQLNDARMKAFQSNLGQSGLLGTAAYTATKLGGLAGNKIGLDIGILNKKNFEKSKEYAEEWRKVNGDTPVKYDESIAGKINDSRVKKAKMIIGGAAAIATGGVAGSAVGVGMIAGGALGGGYAGGYAMSEQSAEGKVSKEISKESKKMGDIEARIAEMKELLKTQTDVMKGGAELGIARDTGKLDENKNAVYEIDETGKKKLRDALAETAVHEQDLKSQLETLNRTIAEKGESPELLTRKGSLRKEMFDLTIKAGKLNALKGIDQTMANTRNQLYNLGGQKSGLSGGNSASAPNPNTGSSEHK